MEKSVDLAKMVQRDVCRMATRPDKGVHQAGFLVLRKTSMPSCLIELGFITTPDEEQLLNSDNGISSIARGIYNAFVSYKKKFDTGISVPYKTYQDEEINIPTIVPDNEISKPIPVKRGNETSEETSESENAVADNNQQENKDSVSEIIKNNSVTEGVVFKIQLVASSRTLRPGSQQFNGLTDIDCYQENGMFKYTYGSSSDYNEIYRLRKTLLDKFPEAFIIAFKGGEKMNINEAIREFKSKRK